VPTSEAAVPGEPSPGLAERAFFAEAAWEGEHRGSEAGGSDDEDDNDDAASETDSQAEWNSARAEADAAGAKRPAWRRASPKWVYPYIVGATLAMGMGMAPKSELFVDLACLAHPPEAPRSLRLAQAAGYEYGYGYGNVPQRGGAASASNFSLTLGGDYSHSHEFASLGRDVWTQEISPADKWFLKLQKDIYDYERQHRVSVPRHELPTTTSGGASGPAGLPSRTKAVPGSTPTGPLPRPDEPDPSSGGGGGGGGDDESTGGDGDGGDDDGSDPSSSGPPFRQIDPALCKKSPVVQAAAAKLTMGACASASMSAGAGCATCASLGQEMREERKQWRWLTRSHASHRRDPFRADDGPLGPAV
jgi:hypothetical protein